MNPGMKQKTGDDPRPPRPDPCDHRAPDQEHWDGQQNWDAKQDRLGIAAAQSHTEDLDLPLNAKCVFAQKGSIAASASQIYSLAMLAPMNQRNERLESAMRSESINPTRSSLIFVRSSRTPVIEIR